MNTLLSLLQINVQAFDRRGNCAAAPESGDYGGQGLDSERKKGGIARRLPLAVRQASALEIRLHIAYICIDPNDSKLCSPVYGHLRSSSARAIRIRLSRINARFW